MIEWWNSLSVVMKILWAITLSASLIFVIQSVMTFLGADVDGGLDVDAGGADIDASGEPGSDLGLLTFRNFVNFFLGFGWTAVLLHDQVSSIPVLLLVSIGVGVLLVAAVMMLFKWLSGMQESGNIDVFKSAVDCQGQVYLTIPAHRQGEGKVQITINNSMREYEAVTDGEELKTGTRIRVVEAVNSSTLLVEESTSIII